MLTAAPPIDPATSLRDVTFCVVDLETTGGSPADDTITEVGAVLVRGGEFLGSFQTFVHPGRSIPARISFLTGITDTMVATAPRPEAVLPTFLEFARGAVLVGHNVRFDRSFLDIALRRAGYAELDTPMVDTCALARRLVRDEVPDCRLSTLASWLRLDHQPTHRALTDALATTDLLHHLLERVPAYSVFRLDDLLALPRLAGHPHAAKLRLTEDLPRTPGVYEFLDRDGRTVYVGKATNLRQRVRSYFGTDDRRTIRPMLGALHQIRHRPAPDPLTAEIIELRLLWSNRPRFNRTGGAPSRPAWLALSHEPFPRLVASARPQPADASLGPFGSLAAARRAQEAIELVAPIRRCTARPRPGVTLRDVPCGPAQLGVAACPCAGVDGAPPGYGGAVAAARAFLTDRPEPAFVALELRMHRLAAALRFEEAALTRDRLAALRAAQRDRATHLAMTSCPPLTLTIGSSTVRIHAGRLDAAEGSGAPTTLPEAPSALPHTCAPSAIDPAHLAEVRTIARWLRRHRGEWTADRPDIAAELLRQLDAAAALGSVSDPATATATATEVRRLDECPEPIRPRPPAAAPEAA